MKKKHAFKKAVSLMMSAAIVTGTVLSAGIFLAPHADAADATVQKYEQQIAQYEKTQNELQEKINANKNEAGKAAETKAYLDTLLFTIESKIVACEALEKELEKSITETKGEIEICEAEVEKYSVQLTKRMRMMQEGSAVSYLEMLFGASSIADFFSRLEHIRTMIEYDRELSLQYAEKKTELDTKKAELESAVTLQANTRASLEKDKAETEKLVGETQKYIDQLAADKAKYQAEYNKAAAAEAELDNKLTEYLRSLQQQNSSPVVAKGEYLWPLPAGKGYITCKFGGSDPNNKPHYALDIAIGAGTPIYATNEGTVLVATWHESYGYYILIDHGNGMASLYAHCSALLVSAGQHVSQGQTIGKVGTTGFSKGNHLHFEIRKNGAKTNPLNYMAPQAPEYIL